MAAPKPLEYMPDDRNGTASRPVPRAGTRERGIA